MTKVALSGAGGSPGSEILPNSTPLTSSTIMASPYTLSRWLSIGQKIGQGAGRLER